MVISLREVIMIHLAQLGIKNKVTKSSQKEITKIIITTMVDTLPVVMVVMVATLPVVVTLVVAVRDLHLHDALALLAMAQVKAWTKSTIAPTTLAKTIPDIAVNVDIPHQHTPTFANHARYATVKAMWETNHSSSHTHKKHEQIILTINLTNYEKITILNCFSFHFHLIVGPIFYDP